MKWGRRNSASLSLPHLFPIPWLAKLKQLGVANQYQPAKSKQKPKPESPKNATSMSVCTRPSRLSDDGFPSNISCSPNAFDQRTSPDLTRFAEREDEFWSFSFRQQPPKGTENSTSTEDGLEFQFFNSRSSVKAERQNTDLQIPKVSLENETTENAEELKERRLSKEQRTRQVDGKIAEDKEDVVAGREDSLQCNKRSKEQDPKPVESDQKEKIPPPNSRKSFAKTEKEETRKPIARCSNKPEEKVKDLVPRRKPRQKVKVGPHSPQMASRVEKRRVRTLKNLKKEKKKGSKTEQCRSFESFAVAKSSFDPQKDFRESMVDMILEHRIEGPQELESLLACYLSLNSAEHHDLIVKVFQQVWFELNRSRLMSELEKGYENYE